MLVRQESKTFAFALPKIKESLKILIIGKKVRLYPLRFAKNKRIFENPNYWQKSKAIPFAFCKNKRIFENPNY